MKFWIIILTATLLTGCRCEREASTASEKAEKVLNLAIWSNFINLETVSRFEKETGIKVLISNYSSNEELLAKLQAGATGYDVAVPSDYMVSIMAKSNLLEPLKRNALSHFGDLESTFLQKSFDPNNKFSVPYCWSVSGIAINRSRTKAKIASWKDVWATHELKGQISLLDDARETLGAMLKANGVSLNTTQPEEIAKARQVLAKYRSHIRAYTSEPLDIIVQGEVAVAHMYSTDALQAREKAHGHIDFVLPVEGGAMSIDNLVIPRGAKHLDAAHQFINFLVTAQANAELVRTVWGGPVVKGVAASLPKELQSNKTLFPAAEALTHYEHIEDLGDATALYDRAWTEIKAGAI